MPLGKGNTGTSLSMYRCRHLAPSAERYMERDITVMRRRLRRSVRVIRGAIWNTRGLLLRLDFADV